MVKNFTALENASDDIVLVVIDDKSTAKYRWPWKRELYAKIFEYLNDYCDTKLIGFDAIVANLDKDNPQSDKEFFDTVKKTSNLVVGFSLIDDKLLIQKLLKFTNKPFTINSARTLKTNVKNIFTLQNTEAFQNFRKNILMRFKTQAP